MMINVITLQPLVALIGQDANFIAQILFESRDFNALDHLRAFVFFCALAREDFHVNNDAFDTRRADE